MTARTAFTHAGDLLQDPTELGPPAPADQLTNVESSVDLGLSEDGNGAKR